MAVVWTCPDPVNCPGVDSPLANTSSELPDSRRFFGFHYEPNYSQLCITEDEALALICDPPPPTNPPTPVVYTSSPQTCTVDCGDGNVETYTAVAGTAVGMSQAEADAAAHAFACLVAQILCDGGEFQIYTSAAQTCVVNCANGTSASYTLPAGVFSALSQAEADASAYLFACALAQAICDGLPPLPIPDGAGPPTDVLWANAPQSCSYLCPDGSVFSYTVGGGLFIDRNAAAANARAHAYACRLAVIHRVCMGDITTEACADALYASDIPTDNIVEPATWTVVGGALPTGLILFGNQIIGYPLAGGTFTFTVRATGADGNYAEKSYSIRVVEIDPASLPDGDLNTAYAQALSTVGSEGTIVWTIIDGALPTGLSMNPNTGVIAGTPTEAGDFDFTIQASET